MVENRANVVESVASDDGETRIGLLSDPKAVTPAVAMTFLAAIHIGTALDSLIRVAI
jgi:hypothetical protein